MAKSKQCTSCKEIKNISEMGRNKKTLDGLSSWCKDCHKQAIDKYHSTPLGKVSKKRSKKKYDKSSHGKRKRNEDARLYNKLNRPKQRAREAVWYHVRTKKIPPASNLMCDVCGKNATQYHHHMGYDKKNWLNVIPVCIPCHVNTHRKEAKKC